MLTYDRSPGDGALRKNITRALDNELATRLMSKENVLYSVTLYFVYFFKKVTQCFTHET